MEFHLILNVWYYTEFREVFFKERNILFWVKGNNSDNFFNEDWLLYDTQKVKNEVTNVGKY